jgi:ABC-type transporter Mla MlaB component
MAVIRRERDGSRALITLSGDLTVSHVREMHAALHEAVHSAPEIVVTLDRITEVDVTLPQLLCSVHRTTAELRKRLILKVGNERPMMLLLRNLGFYRQGGCGEISGADCLWRCTEGR